MTSEEPLPDRCAAECRGGGYCKNYPLDGSDRCRMHGGTTPTKADNPDVGPPEGSANGLTHGSTADPTNLYNNLNDEQREWIDLKKEAYLEQGGIEPGSPTADLVELAIIHFYQARTGHGELIKNGLSRQSVKGVSESGSPITDDEEHYLNRVVSRHTTDFRMALKDAGALDDPESQKADAIGELGDGARLVFGGESE